jgi:hypothetical protein
MLAMGVAGACVFALVVAPMRFSWPRLVRWCVGMQAVTAADPAMVASRIDVREVRLARVAPARDELLVVVREDGRAEWDVTSLASPPPPPDDVALLRDWCDLGTPMLLHHARDGRVSLVGPVPSATSGFHALTPVA